MNDHEIPIERSAFEIVAVNSIYLFTLHSNKHKRTFELNVEFYDVDLPNVGDILELPDCMLCIDSGSPVFSNRMLSFGEPDSTMTIPDGFNIENDYAFLTYRKTNERIMLQRFYG